MKKIFICIFFILIASIFNQAIGQSQEQELEKLMESITETRTTDRLAAIKYCLEAEVYAKEIGDNEKLYEIYYTLAAVYSWINHKMSVKYSKKGIQLARKHGEGNESARFYALLGKVSVSKEDFDQAIRLYSVADSIFILEESQYDIAWMKTNIGHALLEKGEYVKAIVLFEKAIQINESLGLKEPIPIDLINLGRCHLKLNKPDLALKLFEEAFVLSDALDDTYGRATAKSMLAEFHHNFKQYSEAVKFAKEAEAISKESNNYYLLKTIYNQLYESYFALSDYEKSIEYLELYHTASDSLLGSKNDNLIADLENTLIIENQNFDNKLLQKEKSRLLFKEKAQTSWNRLLLILLASSVLVLITSIVLFKYRNKGTQLKQRLNDETLKMRNKEITNLAIYIKQRGMFISLIRNDLKVIRETQNETTKNDLITEVFVKVGQYARTDNESGQITKRIEESSQDFISRLSIKYPNLTSKEKKLAQLLRMKLSSKEIAVLLNIAPNSVDTNRYRLRKKLNLTKDDDLIECFEDI